MMFSKRRALLYRTLIEHELAYRLQYPPATAVRIGSDQQSLVYQSRKRRGQVTQPASARTIDGVEIKRTGKYRQLAE